MRKADIQFHGIGYGYRVGPAVNVKIHDRPTKQLCEQVSAMEGPDDPRFTLEWIDQHLSDDQRNTYWEFACSDAWERLQEAVNAENIFGRQVEIFSEGRSGGWAMVKGFEDRSVVEGWDAIAVSRWAKFATYARQQADDVPYQYLDLIYINWFQAWAENQDQAAEYLQQTGGTI